MFRPKVVAIRRVIFDRDDAEMKEMLASGWRPFSATGPYLYLTKKERK